MKTLVTGGAGFIGSHLCDFLLQKDFEVLCMDSLITGKLENIKHITSKNFKYIKHNVVEHINIDGELDYVLHFASPASPEDYLKFPIHTLKVGALGTHNALGLSKAKNSKFLLASTSEVYGDPLEHPQKESYYGNVNPIGPRGVYDEAKRFAEAITMAYHRTHKLDVKIIRIFNVYGPRMRINDGRAIPNFIRQALLNEDLTVYGDGSQTRSFCFISDMIEGIYEVMKCDYNGPINLGNPIENSIIELAEKIITLTKSKSKIAFKQLPENDPKVRKPDISLARKILNGWEPKVSLDDGLKITINYFKKALNLS